MASQWASCISRITGRPRPRPPMARHAAKRNQRRCRRGRHPPQGRVPFCPQIGVSLGHDLASNQFPASAHGASASALQLPRMLNKPPWQLRMNPAVCRLGLVLIDEDSAPKGLELASALGFRAFVYVRHPCHPTSGFASRPSLGAACQAKPSGVRLPLTNADGLAVSAAEQA